MLVFIPTAHQDSVPEERSSCVRGEYCPELISLCLQEQEGKKHPVFPPEALGCPRASGVVSAEFAQHREVQNPARPLWPGSSAELKKAGLQPKWVMHFQSWKIPSFFFFYYYYIFGLFACFPPVWRVHLNIFSHFWERLQGALLPLRWDWEPLDKRALPAPLLPAHRALAQDSNTGAPWQQANGTEALEPILVIRWHRRKKQHWQWG